MGNVNKDKRIEEKNLEKVSGGSGEPMIEIINPVIGVCDRCGQETLLVVKFMDRMYCSDCNNYIGVASDDSGRKIAL